MKKLASLMLALSLALATSAFAEDKKPATDAKPADSKPVKPKKAKAKKAEETKAEAPK